VEVNVPPATNAFLIWSYCFICSCCTRRYYRQYNETLEKVREDVSQNLNIITVFKRLRMHGFALDSLVSLKKRAMLAYLANRKSTSIIMSYEELDAMKNQWSLIENTSSRTKFGLGIVNKFFSGEKTTIEERILKKAIYET